MSHKTEDIRSKPSSREYRDNYDRVFRRGGSTSVDPVSLKRRKGVLGLCYERFKTIVCVTDDKNFGG